MKNIFVLILIIILINSSICLAADIDNTIHWAYTGAGYGFYIGAFGGFIISALNSQNAGMAALVHVLVGTLEGIVYGTIGGGIIGGGIGLFTDEPPTGNISVY